MRILFLSDTHGLHRQLGELPEADVLVHAGDVTRQGTEVELDDFIDWLAALPYPCKFFLGGNHDDCLYGRPSQGELPGGVHYLCNQRWQYGGRSFYFLPFFRPDEASGEYDRQIDAIPEETDILVSHQPPSGILDAGQVDGRAYSFGSERLRRRVDEVRPQIHLFGHNHNGYGQRRVGQTLFANAALVDHDYRLCRPPMLIEVQEK